MALALDASTPAIASADAAATTTASFSPPNNSLLVACIGSNTSGGSPVTITMSNSGAALTWTKQKQEDPASSGTPNGCAAIYTAELLVGRSLTVTATQGSGNNGVSVQVYVFTGYNTSTTIGATGANFFTTSGSVNTAALTTTANGSWVVGCYTDFNAVASTVTSSDTGAAWQADGDVVGIAVRKSAVTASSGTAVTLNTNYTGSPAWVWAAVEVMAAAATSSPFPGDTQDSRVTAASLAKRASTTAQVSAGAEGGVWSNRLLSLLAGKDTFFAAPGQGPDYDYPNPRIKPFPIEMRTFLNPMEAQLIGKDTFYGGQGKPPSYQPPPNPLGYAYPLGLRTWTNDQVRGVLAPPPSPFYQTEWPVPKGYQYPIDLRTVTDAVYLLAGQDTFFGGAGQPPTYQPPPNPLFRPFPLEGRTIADASEFWFLKDTFFGVAGQPPTYQPPPNPWGKAYPYDLRTFINEMAAQLIGQDMFFGEAGQPPTYQPADPPKGYRYPLDLRTWLQTHVLDTLAPGPSPFNETEWPNPLPKRRGVDLLTWARSYQQNTLVPTPSPFFITEWPNPLPKRRGSDLRTWALPTNVVLMVVPPGISTRYGVSTAANPIVLAVSANAFPLVLGVDSNGNPVTLGVNTNGQPVIVGVDTGAQ